MRSGLKLQLPQCREHLLAVAARAHRGPAGPHGALAGGAQCDGFLNVGGLGGGGPGMLAVFTGRNGAGACTLTGATVGTAVEFVLNMTDETADAAKFEATITVPDQIQQTDAGDLSLKHFFVIGG